MTETAEAFLSMARQYHLAAITLQPLHERAEQPVYFLFTHTIELALKAYLRSCNLATPHGQGGHALRDFLEQCHRNGLQVGLDLQNFTQILESENSRHGFRYFLFDATGRPDINWMREVADELMRVIEEEVSKRPTPNLASAVLKIIMSKPVKK